MNEYIFIQCFQSSPHHPKPHEISLSHCYIPASVNIISHTICLASLDYNPHTVCNASNENIGYVGDI